MLWDEILTESRQTGLPPNQTLQEELQKAVLATLSRQNAFHHIVFQGGTALRLFYGNPRFSEDLDFVINPPSSSFDLSKHLAAFPSAIEPLFPFLDTVTIRVQKHDRAIQRYILSTESGNPQQQARLHIELAMVPSHQSTLKILLFPPLQPAVRVEIPEEILADKLLALGNRSYIKGRDLWDVYFLTTEKQVTPPWELVWRKTQDYQTTASAVKQQLHRVTRTLKQQGKQLLSGELERFLPPSAFTAYQDLFDDILAKVVQVIEGADKGETR